MVIFPYITLRILQNTTESLNICDYYKESGKWLKEIQTRQCGCLVRKELEGSRGWLLPDNLSILSVCPVVCLLPSETSNLIYISLHVSSFYPDQGTEPADILRPSTHSHTHTRTHVNSVDVLKIHAALCYKDTRSYMFLFRKQTSQKAL